MRHMARSSPREMSSWALAPLSCKGSSQRPRHGCSSHPAIVSSCVSSQLPAAVSHEFASVCLACAAVDQVHSLLLRDSASHCRFVCKAMLRLDCALSCCRASRSGW